MSTKKQRAAGKRLARKAKCAWKKARNKFGKKKNGAARRKPTKAMWKNC